MTFEGNTDSATHHNGQPETGILWLRLDADSKELLQKLYPHKYPAEYYHHVTLVFGTTRELLRHPIGTLATVRAYAHAHNADIEAVRVETDGLPDTYGVPHITLSAQPGVGPFRSVAMLQGDHQEEPIDPPLELKGDLEFNPL
jgi:hypothetical protein